MRGKNNTIGASNIINAVVGSCINKSDSVIHCGKTMFTLTCLLDNLLESRATYSQIR